MSRKRPKTRDAEIEDDSILENTKEQEKEQKEFFKKTRNQLAAVAGAFFVIGFLLSTVIGPSMTGYVVAGDGSELSVEEVGDKVIESLNTYLLMEGYDAEVISAEKTSGMVVIDVEISTGDQSQEVTFYASNDGKYLFLSAPADMDSLSEEPEEEETESGYPKSDVPNVKMFVMSFCPYGQQAEDGLGPAMEAIGEFVDFEPHFVLYESYGDNGPNYCLEDEDSGALYCSMHGINELNEDMRQAVIWKYYPEKWWDYVNGINADCSSGNVETCWKDAAEAAGLNVADIEAKFEAEKLELAAAEYALCVEYGVRGSPSIFVNDVKYAGARSAESFKTEICSAFNTPPEECGETLEGGTATASGSC